MRDDIRLDAMGRPVLADATTPTAYRSPAGLLVPPAHPSLAHLDTRPGREAALAAMLGEATPDQLDSAARHHGSASPEAMRLVRAEMLRRGMAIPLPVRR